jgi:HSP20 family protein
MTPVLEKKQNDLLPSLLTDFFDADRFFAPDWFERSMKKMDVPMVNIKENGKEFLIELAAPGFNKGDFKVEVEDNLLTISAERKEEKKEKDERFTRKEFSYNSISRSFTLPEAAKADKIDAKFTDGILYLNIPKREEVKHPSKQAIKVN